MAQAAGKRTARAKKSQGGKLALVIALIVVAALIVGYLILCAMAGSGTFLPNTTIAGIEVGGSSQEQALTTLEEQLPQRLSQISATFTCEGRTYTVTGEGATVNTQDAVQSAMDSQASSFLTRGVQYLTAMTGGSQYPAQVSLSGTPDAVTQAVEECADPESQTTWEVKDDQLVFHKGVTGRTIDTAALTDALEERLSAQLSGDATEDQDPIEAQVTTAAPIDPDFDDIQKQITVEAADAYLDKSTKQIVPSVTGISLDTAAARSALDSAAEGSDVSVPLTKTEPEMTTADLEANLFKDVLGQSSTRTAGGSSRWHNVDLACQRVNGTILLPGETFSYNATCGPYSQAGGYQKAGAYVSGTTKDTWAGGICQLSSTIYWTTLKANLETVERHRHQFDVGYLPSGMDATVYSNSLDFKFKNNTDYPIKIVASLTRNSSGTRYCNVTIYGTNATGIYGDPYSVVLSTISPQTRYEPNASIPQGTKPQKDPERTAYTGKKVAVYQRLRDASGKVISETLIHTDTFDHRDAYYFYNPADAARWGIDTSTGLKTLTPVVPTTTPAATPSSKPSSTPAATPSTTPSTAPTATPTPAATPTASVGPGMEPTDSTPATQSLESPAA